MAKFNVKRILRVAVIFVLIAAIYLFLGNSRYFKLDTIEVIDKSHATTLKADNLLPMYEGRNIFRIDIDSLSAQIKRDTPTIKHAIVKKILPNKLEIDIVPRVPIAKIKSHGYFPIDRTGMILSPDIKTEKLPVIMGFSVWLNPKVGTKLENPQVRNAFLLIDALEESAVLSDYAISAIDVSNYRNLSFYLEDGIEVKIGSEDFLDRLYRLRTTFAKPELDKENIKYIDLRFKDVVIGPK
ncbi:MAG: cell division protein FtsQ/DivIB [Candidatus Omnitrophota bacterium]|nr:MAG: cell division protein FtsQ/DivIB [Candidatus Omnitrophota bacterium]